MTDPNRRFVKIFNIGYFVILCMVGVLCLYLAPSKLGQIDNIYIVETTVVKMGDKLGNLQLESNKGDLLICF